MTSRHRPGRHPAPQLLIDRQRAREMLLRRENLLKHDARRQGTCRRLRGRKTLRVVLIDVVGGRSALDKDRLIQQRQ